MFDDLRHRFRCVINAYRTAMQYQGKRGPHGEVLEPPREVAREQVRIFLEAVEREYQAIPRRPHGYFHREF